MTMAKTRNKFSRKTVAIAIASAVVTGGIAIPQAGAMGGYTYNRYALDTSDVQGWSEKHPDATSEALINYQQNESPLMSVPGYDVISTVWNLDYSNDAWAGYATDVPTSNGVIDGLFVTSLSGLGSPLSQDTTFTYGTAHSLKDVQNEYPTLNGKESRPLSLDAKRVLYTAARLGHASVNGITPDVKADLKGAGYDIDDAKSSTAKYLNSANEYGEFRFNDQKVSEQDIQDGVRKEKSETPLGARNSIPVITLTDFLFTALSATAGGAWSAETDYVGSDEPATLDQIRGLAKQNTMLNLGNFSDDYEAFVDAVVELASAVTEEEIENSDIPMYWNESEGAREKFQYIPAIDVANAKFNPNTPEETTPAEDLHVTNVEKLDNGNYEVTRNDGESWIIDLKDIHDKIAELEKKDSPSREEFDKIKEEIDKAEEDIKDLNAKDDALQKEIDNLKKDVEGLKNDVNDLKNKVKGLENAGIKEVVKNDDGTYTLIRNDGTKVPGNIDTSGSVTNIKTDGKGNLIVTIDGKDKVVPLDQVKVTESNKGTPKHTVTITTPDGKSVTFNVFDTYVTNVEKDKDGNYKVTRNDGESWIINLKDIRDKIAELEKKESPSKEDFNKIKEEINNLDNRLTKIEARLTKVEGRTDALTKCVAGAGMAGIPAMLAIPLMAMTQLNIPGIKDLNTQIQKQIGIFNPELARQWERNGGVLQAGAALAGLAGMIGGIAYIANQCDPMMKTDAAKETDLGQLSSKLEDAKAGSSDKDKAEDKGSSVDAGSSTGESTGEGSSTEAGSSTDKDKQ